MMRKIIYTRPDGRLCVVGPQLNDDATTEAEAEARAWDRLPADAIKPRFAAESEIPQDRTFRNAWIDGPNGLEHDMGRCREIHKNRLRELRAPKLAALDMAYQRADETNDFAEKAAIARSKQALRDVTADRGINAASTPTELKACIPECLK